MLASSAGVAPRRLALNVGSNAGYMALNALLMLWYVPFLIGRLGLAAYGMIPLANSLVMYATVLTASLDVSVTRFLAIDLNRGDVRAANTTFNAAIVLAATASLVLTIPAGVVVWLFPTLFNVPAGLEGPTRVLFASVTAAVCAAMLSSSFGMASVIRHRFELRNLVRAVTSLSRVGIVVLCFFLWGPGLSFVAAGFFGSAVVGVVADVLVSRHLAPELRVAPRHVDRRQIRAMLGLSVWSAINQVGALALMQIDLLVINLLYGPAATGLYGSILVLIALIHSVTETVAAVLGPVIMAHYAASDADGLRRFALRSMRNLGLLLALPVGLLCGFARPVLTIWLGREFGNLDVILLLLAAHLPLSLSLRPLLYSLTAYNRVKLQSVVTLALGLATVPLALFFARVLNWGLMGVAAATSLVWLLRSLLFVTPYAASVLEIRARRLYGILAGTAVSTGAVALAGLCSSQALQLRDWVSLLLCGVVASLAYVVIVGTGILSAEDREFILAAWPRRAGPASAGAGSAAAGSVRSARIRNRVG